MQRSAQTLSWWDAPLHVVDFEGTALGGIVEYGVVTLQGGVVVATHTRICKPKQSLKASDIQLHAIKPEWILTQEPIEADWELFANLAQTGPLAAHHAVVEDGLLRSIWPFCRSRKSWLDATPTANWGPWIDTHVLYQRWLKGTSDYKLETLIQACGLRADLEGLAQLYCPPKRRQWHSALYDALACALLLRKLGELEAVRQYSISALMQVSRAGASRQEFLDI